MSRFPTTQWSLVDLASRESATGSRENIGRLLETYRQPMYVHLRARGVKHEQAEDLIQDFLMETLDQKLLTIADPTKGKFRTLLLTALDRYMIGRYRYETAAKRSQGELASLDASESTAPSAVEANPSLVFERAWALDVLAQALERMHEECTTQGLDSRWFVFESRVVSPLLEDAAKPEYDELANTYDLKDEKAAMNLLVTGKRQFARILREIVRDYVTRASDTDKMRETVANQLATRETKPETATRVAHHVVEQSVRHAVQEEIDELGDILSRSWPVAEFAQRPGDEVAENSPTKSRFLRRLSAIKEPPKFDELYKSAGDSQADDQIPLGDYLLAVLDSDISEFPGLRTEATGTLRSCLMADQPQVDVLRSIKDWANLLRATRDKTLPGDLANGIYYLVIAVGLVRCDAIITGLGKEALRSGFVWLGEQHWLPDEMRPLIKGARAKLGG